MNLRKPNAAQPYYRVRWMHTGLWAVAHLVPGTTDTWSVDRECGSVQAAEKEAAWMNAERDAEQRREAERQKLLPMRWGRLA
jgi:hypothetical protein